MSLHYKPKIVNDQEGCLLLSTMWNREIPVALNFCNMINTFIKGPK